MWIIALKKEGFPYSGKGTEPLELLELDKKSYF